MATVALLRFRVIAQGNELNPPVKQELTGGCDHTVILWDALTAEKLVIYRCHDKGVFFLTELFTVWHLPTLSLIARPN